MDTIILKFGGSSLADNVKLNIVANKIIEFYEKGNRVVVVLSAQGKTTDNLIKEAKELSAIPDEREMDVLLSTGEQIAISKMAILLKRLGYNAISLTGWQVGIYTNSLNQESKIEYIDTERIQTELDNNRIVLIAGFQGINDKGDITTLGRSGSDTTAIAIASVLKANHCYIFSDVEGIYTSDPNRVEIAKKIDVLSYTEMLEMSNEGAKVLHNRCVEIARKYNVPIETGSTFNNNSGTIVSDILEDTSIKGIVKNDDILLVNLKHNVYTFSAVYELILQNNIIPNNLVNNNSNGLDISFTIKTKDLDKFQNLLENSFPTIDSVITNISRISIIGYGILNNDDTIKNILKIIKENNLEILSLQMDECKISVMLKERVEDKILIQLHRELIK